MTEIPNSWFNFFTESKIVALREASTADTGSSAKIIFGCNNKALATITLCL